MSESEESILAKAVDLKSAEQRATYLDDACADQPELRQRIESLLSAFDEGAFLENPPADLQATAEAAASSDESGTRIGPYRLLQKIGQGGMGEVYMAEQREPIKRRVAVKLIKLGMDTKQVVARFEVERQALALMDHPNIAKVFDAGATEAGRPYFVMELVRGVPITQFCDENMISTTQRLELFIPVCQAIQHAHQKAIIHRDIKPSNVLVTMHDDKPVPKVIDFGIAKATQSELTAKTLFTRFEQFIGTPAYMSPEQAQMSGLDIDTRCDVYALGVLLYEMLTGVTPFDQKELLQCGYEEICRRLREDEPPKPSTRVSTMDADSRTAVAKSRRADADKLGWILRGELDWIIMKALEKDRTRRYETANTLAQDVQRFLSGEAVLACPPSTTYRLRKFVHRNRGPVIASAMLLLVLCLGFVGTSLGLYWARLAEARASQEATNAKVAATRATRQAQLTSDALAEVKKQRYYSQVRLASERLGRGDDLVARQDLLDAPAEYRNWEWGYLVGRAWPPEIDLDRVKREPSVSAAEYWATAPAGAIRELEHGFQRRVATFALAHDGERMLTGIGDGSLREWDLHEGEPLDDYFKLTTEEPSQIRPTALGFSKDDRLLAFGDVGGGVFLFDADSKANLWSGELQKKQIYYFWFGPGDGDSRLVAADRAGIVGVFDADSGKRIREFTEHATEVQSLCFRPDDESAISASIDGSINIWELETGKRIGPLESVLPHGNVDSCAIKINSTNLQQVAVGYVDGSVILWDRETGKKRDIYKGDDRINSLEFSNDGTCLFVAEGQRLIKVLDVDGNLLNTVTSIRPMVRTDSFALTADDTRIVAVLEDGIAFVWAPVLAKREVRRTLTTAHNGVVLQAAYSSDGQRIVTASYDKTACVWDTVSQELICSFSGHEHELLKADFSPDGKYVASLDCRGIVRVWDAKTANEIYKVEADPAGFFRSASSEGGLQGAIMLFSAVFSSNPFFDKGLVANHGKEMAVFDYQTGDLRRTLEENPRFGWPVVGPRGKHVAVITDSLKEIHLWDLETGKKRYVLAAGHDKVAYWAEFSPDGLKLVTSSMAGKCVVWDVLTGEHLVEIPSGPDYTAAARFSLNGNYIATASADHTAKIWDAVTGDLLTTFDDHTFVLTNVEFSPDGTRVFTTGGMSDKNLRVWDPHESNARELVRFTRNAQLTYGTWSPDGSQILTCWSDGSVYLLEAFPWKDGNNDPTVMDKRVRKWHEGRTAPDR